MSHRLAATPPLQLSSSSAVVLGISSHRSGAGYVIVRVAGELDRYNARQLSRQLLELTSDGSEDIIMDINEVQLNESAALAAGVGGHKRMRARDGWFAFVCCQEQTLYLLTSMSLATLLRTCDSVDSAIAEWHSSRSP